jgi:hypothetical protein
MTKLKRKIPEADVALQQVARLIVNTAASFYSPI